MFVSYLSARMINKNCVCVWGGGDDKPASSVVVYRTCSALEAWSWNAVSHETEGTTTAPAEVVVD